MSEPNNKGDENKTVKSVERALIILETLAKIGVPTTITEISKRTNLSPGTTHRLLHTMMQRGFVAQNPENSKYRLGIKAFQIGNISAYFKDLRSAARPVLEELQKRYNETVNLAILDGSEVVYIDQVESTNIVVVRMFAQTGSRGPAHCTGSGKVLLAGLPPNQLKEVVYNMDLIKYTDKTITDPEELIKELNQIKQRGYAIDNGERDEGVWCAAAPIKNTEGMVVAAVSISVPSIRVDSAATQTKLINAIIDGAKRISTQLGYIVY